MLVRLATHAAIAISNARMYHQLHQAAISDERERISHEMQDGLAQVLGYVNTKAQASETLIRAGQSEQAVRQISQLAAAVRDAYADLREDIIGLQVAAEPGRNWVEALQAYVAKWRELGMMEVRFDSRLRSETASSLPSMVELQVIRIVQEALSNVRKHSAATSASPT
ncbi:MAG: histidine kinase [Chloroflexota bacterium]|nr:histidine kinase [Chloroflexota bacterium]